MKKLTFLFCALFAGFYLFIPITHADTKLKVVATFSILEDFIKEIGADRIEVTTLVSRNSDAHVFQPSPTETKAVSEADLLVLNGLGFEGWIERLETSSGFAGSKLIATSSIEPLTLENLHHDNEGHAHDHIHGQYDPHAWQSVPNAKIYVNNIKNALVNLDPDNSSYYSANTKKYIARLDELDQMIRSSITEIPESKRTVISAHDAFRYFSHEYGLTFKALQGLSTESEVSAADMSAIIRQIRSEHISAIFLENISDPRLMRQVSRETNAVVGGNLFSDALSDKSGLAPNYIQMMQYNIATIVTALKE